MKRLLHISSSINLETSSSRAIGHFVVNELRAAIPSMTIVRRDLATDSPPHIDPQFLVSLTDPKSNALALSHELVDELKSIDLLVLESAMYNYAIPSTLKAWIDHIVRAGLTFRFGENGPEGLLQHIKAILVLGSGGVYSEGPAKFADHQEPYLRTLLSFLGISDIETIRIEGTSMGEQKKQASLQIARDRAAEVVRRLNDNLSS